MDTARRLPSYSRRPETVVHNRERKIHVIVLIKNFGIKMTILSRDLVSLMGEGQCRVSYSCPLSVCINTLL